MVEEKAKEEAMIRALRAVSTREANRTVALYITGMPERKVRKHIAQKTFSGARAIDHMRNPNTKEARNAWSRGEIVCRAAGLPVRRQHWNDRNEDDLTGIQQTGPTATSAGQFSVSSLQVYLPRKVDIEDAIKQLRKFSDEIIYRDDVLGQVEKIFKKAGKPLKENWREITKLNFEIWFPKKP